MGAISIVRQQKWIYFKLLIFLLLIVVVSGSIIFGIAMKKNEDIRFVEKMGAGWNLGNSLDTARTGLKDATVFDYETNWGNPQTSREMIRKIHQAGFSTIRIPITWTEHMDEEGNIDEEWMNRVREVVDYAINEELYVIINAHHDEWYYPTYSNETEAKKKIEVLWNQISQMFADYDEHLLFESMNEPRLIGTDDEWTSGTEEAQVVVNRLNQCFVEVVRNSGGFNKDRYLLIPTYCASGKRDAMEAMIIPNDQHIIVSLHQYIPYDFALNDTGTSQWDVNRKNDTYDIDKLMLNIKEIFLNKGIPVIIGEFGAVDKGNLDERLEWLSYYKNSADREKVMLIWWDAGGDEKKDSSFRIFDRYTLQWIYPEIKDILTRKR
jgi:endoglucanase